MSSNKAWVTLATNDSYSLGALVLAHSLKTVNTAHKLAILITPGVTDSMKKQIEGVFDDVKVVDVLDSKDQTHLALMCRPELGVTFTKLHCWTLTKYEKCVFLDADTLVLQNCDELFERDELSAAPDPGWPDCFNSGVFVYKPSEDTFNKLLEFARTKGSFDGGDQGLLNMFFKEWAHKDISKHLSFTYNVVWSSTYSYLPALKQFGQNMKIIHFIASSKPWLQSFNTETRLVTATSGGSGLQALLQLWWDLFCRHVHPSLSTEMIESRLSSRYSNDSQSKIFQNNIPDSYTSVNNNSKNYYAPNNKPPKEDHYTFIDPWEEYLVTNDQGNYNIEREKTFMCQNENVRGDSMVDVRMGNDQNKQEVENNDCKNNCHMEEQIRDYSFQNLVMENVNTSGDEEKKDEHFEEVREFHESKQEHYQINNKNGPACSDANPINLNSSLSVNNCRPDSPTNCEVPKDQICDLNGGLAGQFARVSLGEKTTDQKALEDFLRRQSWEQGNMDYLGKDSFSNIWAKINETLGNTSEVQIESSAVKTPSPPEVVHIEKPKPLKSALKKSSTTIPPVESELVISSDPSVKQLEKLDLSKEVSKEQTPDTPTVTSPTPPTTPATQTKDSPKPESIKETPKSDVCAKESLDSVEQETPKLEATEPKKETPKSDVCSSLSSETLEQILPETDLSVPKVEPLKEISQTIDTIVQEPQSSVDNSTQLISDAPPVAPKRSNKGSQKPTEKK